MSLVEVLTLQVLFLGLSTLSKKMLLEDSDGTSLCRELVEIKDPTFGDSKGFKHTLDLLDFCAQVSINFFLLISLASNTSICGLMRVEVPEESLVVTEDSLNLPFSQETMILISSLQV